MLKALLHVQPIVRISIVALLSGCAGGAIAPYSAPMASGGAALVRPSAALVYQPLAVGGSWKYICNNSFTILDRVVGA
jgi:hypothetical protein